MSKEKSSRKPVPVMENWWLLTVFNEVENQGPFVPAGGLVQGPVLSKTTFVGFIKYVLISNKAIQQDLR